MTLAVDLVVERYTDAFGHEALVPAEVRRAVLAAMGGEAASARDPVVLGAPGGRLDAPADLVLEDGTSLGTVIRLPRDVPFGYHHLVDEAGERLLLVPPARCAAPAGRGWVWSVQLPTVRSAGSWGIGDLADLRALAAWTAEAGGRGLLVNPLGAANPSPDPEPSPYYPSTRRFHHPLLLRIEEIPGAARLAGIQRIATDARRLNERSLIDRAAVQRHKLAALERIWRSGLARRAHADGLSAFRAREGEALHDWAVFATLCERHEPGWQRWPEELRAPRSPAVSAFAAAHADRVAFHEWVQWLCDEQLGAAAGAGAWLLADLPVGFDPGGFDAWAWQDLVAAGARIGAPPDPFNPVGQDWGLPPFVPHRLREAHLAPFIETVRSALRHARGLRIDHVMSLFRLWWIPVDGPGGGAYVRYPSEELLAVLAIESRRAKAVIIGEDLGTVERGVRRALARRGLLSTRLVYFEGRGPARFPRGVFAGVTTHDLPTIAGVWHGSDLDDVRAAGLAVRPGEIGRLRTRLARAAGVEGDASVEAVVLGVHRALAASPAVVVSATLEDALRVEARPNLPGTTGEQRANWSRALPATVEALERDPFVAQLAKVLSR